LSYNLEVVKVPPYVPQPIEIPGNVTEEPYMVRLGFIRRVVAVFGVSLLVVAGASVAPLKAGPYDFVFVILSLMLLSAGRGVVKGRPIEQRLSLVLSVTLFLSLGLLVHRLLLQGWPLWSIGLGCVALMAYTFLCGRDLSFTGMWFLSGVGSTLLIVGMGWALRESTSRIIMACLLNAACLSYIVYDLAALLTRRRLGEEIGAVLDLYRDVLNMFSYPVRVWNHWRKHNIWSPRS
jgi:hypothetical protein